MHKAGEDRKNAAQDVLLQHNHISDDELYGSQHQKGHLRRDSCIQPGFFQVMMLLLQHLQPALDDATQGMPWHTQNHKPGESSKVYMTC